MGGFSSSYFSPRVSAILGRRWKCVSVWKPGSLPSFFLGLKRLLIFLHREGPVCPETPRLPSFYTRIPPFSDSHYALYAGLCTCAMFPISPKKHTMPLVPACNPRVGLTNNNSGDAGFLHYPDTDFDAFLAGTRYPMGWTMEFLNRTLVHDSFGCS